MSGREAAIGWLLIAASLFVCLHATLEPATRWSRDFANIYAGAYCVAEHCQPYSVFDLNAVLLNHGFAVDDDWATNLPIYPPTTLGLMIPLTGFSFHVAARIFYCISLFGILACGIAIFVRSKTLASLSPALRGLLLATIVCAPKLTWVLCYGNPSALTLALILFCCFDSGSSRVGLRATLLALACLLKPQLAVPMSLVLLFKPDDGWRTLRRTVAILTVYTAAVLLWCSRFPETRHWFSSLLLTLRFGAISGQSMNANDRAHTLDTMLNLQYLLGYAIQRPGLRSVLVLLIFGTLAAGLAVALRRLMHGTTRALLMLLIATMAALTLLPVYHRFYDSVLLLLALPWVGYAIQRRRTIWPAALVLLLMASTYASWIRRIPEEIRGREGVPMPPSLFAFFTHRLDALTVLLIAVILLVTLLRETAPLRHARALQASEPADGLLELPVR